MSPLIWDLAHVGNYEDLWLLRRARRPRARPTPHRRHLRRLPHPRSDRPTLPLLDDGRGPRATSQDVRAAPLDAARRHRSRRRRRLLRRRLRLRDGRAARAPARRDDAGHAPPHGGARLPPGPAPPPATRAPWPTRCSSTAGSFVMGTDDEPWAYDNERPAHVVDLAPFWIDAAPVTNGEYAAVRRRRRLRRPPCWTDDGLGVAPGGRSSTRSSGAATATAGAARASAGRAAAGRRAGAARLLVRGRRLRPLGRQAAADRGRVGEGGGVGPRGQRQRRYPWGDEPPTRPREPRPAPLRAGPGRRLPGRRQRVRLRADDRRRVGVDGVGLPAYPGLRAVPVPGVLRGLLRPRLQGAARRLVGHPPDRRAHHVPQLGLPDPPPDLRRLPLRAGRRDGHR